MCTWPFLWNSVILMDIIRIHSMIYLAECVNNVICRPTFNILYSLMEVIKNSIRNNWWWDSFKPLDWLSEVVEAFYSVLHCLYQGKLSTSQSCTPNFPSIALLCIINFRYSLCTKINKWQSQPFCWSHFVLIQNVSKDVKMNKFCREFWQNQFSMPQILRNVPVSMWSFLSWNLSARPFFGSNNHRPQNIGCEKKV